MLHSPLELSEEVIDITDNIILDVISKLISNSFLSEKVLNLLDKLLDHLISQLLYTEYDNTKITEALTYVYNTITGLLELSITLEEYETSTNIRNFLSL